MARQNVMSAIIEFIVGAIFEMLGSAVVKFLGMEDIVEFVTCAFGFLCIVGGLGYAIWGK